MATDTHITYLQFRNLLAARLGDAGKIHYIDNELKRYTLETLRTWNSLAGYSKERGTINSIANQVWYNIPTGLLNSGVPICDYTLTDQDLFVDVKIALMEDSQNLTTNAWNGTEQFNLDIVENAIEKARNEYLLRTSSILTNMQVAVVAPPIGRVPLPDTVIDLVRVAFKSNVVGSKYRALQRTDELQANYFNNLWNIDPTTPLQYSKSLTPRSALQLIPVPATNGFLDILYVSTGADLDIINGTLLNIPTDMAWIVKFGALYYLLSQDGEGQDIARANYCKSRFEQGIQLASLSSTILQAYINDIPTTIVTPKTLDDWDIHWQSTTGTPSRVIVASSNIIGLSKVPTDGLTSITLDVVRNHPVPIADADFIQVGREYINRLLDYAVHLASFKEGEVDATMYLLDGLMQAASEHNLRLAAQGFDFNLYRSLDKQQNMEVPLKLQESDYTSRNMGNYGVGT